VRIEHRGPRPGPRAAVRRATEGFEPLGGQARDERQRERAAQHAHHVASVHPEPPRAKLPRRVARRQAPRATPAVDSIAG